MKKVSVAFLLFSVSPAMAIVVSDGTNMCGVYAYDKMYAMYEVNSYTCSSGQFLPADALACASCPTDYTCAGGTFDFNAKNNQGLSNQTTFSHDLLNTCAENAPHGFIATYSANSYTCAAGQYLPADGIACAACPTGGNCSGGTYTYNATTNQGVDSCDAGYYKDNGTCVGNTITVTWDGADSEDIAANNAGTIIYGGDIRTPKKARHINGKVFVGWKFDDPQ